MHAIVMSEIYFLSPPPSPLVSPLSRPPSIPLSPCFCVIPSSLLPSLPLSVYLPLYLTRSLCLSLFISVPLSHYLSQGANASALEKEIGPEQFPVNEHYFGLVNVSVDQSKT